MGADSVSDYLFQHDLPDRRVALTRHLEAEITRIRLHTRQTHPDPGRLEIKIRRRPRVQLTSRTPVNAATVDIVPNTARSAVNT